MILFLLFLLLSHLHQSDDFLNFSISLIYPIMYGVNFIFSLLFLFQEKFIHFLLELAHSVIAFLFDEGLNRFWMLFSLLNLND